MDDNRHERRAQHRHELPPEQVAIVSLVRRVVRDEFSDRMTFRKNGHTWSEWLEKLLTPDRLIMATIAIITSIYVFGGDVREFQRDHAAMTDFIRQQRNSDDERRLILRQIDAANMQIEAANEALKQQEAAIEATRAQQAALAERLQLSVTRREFNESMNQRVIPRLDRIETTLKTK